MTKQELRKLVAESIRQMSDSEREMESINVCMQIQKTEAWEKAHTVLLYCAMRDEISLQKLIDSSYEQKKTVILPVVDGPSLLLRVYSPEHLAIQGPYPIEEPTADCPVFENLQQLDIAIIPGRAFSKEGNRLGRGKGYYDKLLPMINCPKWGAAFTCQIKQDIPSDEWDVKMDRVITGFRLSNDIFE